MTIESIPVASTHNQTSAHAPTAPSRPDTVPNPIFRLVSKAVVQLIRYWWALGAAMTISLAAAVGLCTSLAETAWTVESVLVYMRLPIDTVAERLYVPPDLRTVTSLVESPSVLTAAVEQAKLDISPRALSSMLSVEEPRGTKKLQLKLTHTDPAEGRRIVAAVTEAYQQYVAEMRREQVKFNLRDLETSQTRNELRMKVANQRLMEFAGANSIDDLETETQNLKSSISNLEYQFNNKRVEEQALRIQQRSVQAQLDGQKREEQLKLESEKEAEAAEESLADNRRRQDRLNELIGEERRLNEIRALLTARQGEFDRKIVLFEKGYLSRNDFETIQSQVDALKSQIMEGAKIDEWKQELSRIDKMVVPKAKSRRVGSPIIHQTMFKLVELDLGILASEESQRQLSVSLIEQRRRQSKLKRCQVEQSGLLAEIEAINEERDSLNSQHSALTAVHDIGPYEFAIAQSPTSDMYPPMSNKKKLFAMTFLGINFLLVTPVLMLALITAQRKTVMEFAEDERIPFLTRRPSIIDLLPERTPDVVQQETSAWCRTVALRIQQLSPRRGAVISIIPGKPYQYQGDLALLEQISGVLAQRDERVLIIQIPRTSQIGLRDTDLEQEANTNQDQRRGLFDYANDAALTLDDIVTPVSNGVDLIAGGSCDPERLFSVRTNALLSEVSQKYSLVLLYGVCMHETTNVEMLSRHSDGMLVFHDRMDLMSREIAETVQNLKLLQAPLLGMAVRVGAERRPRIRFLFRHLRNRKQPPQQE